MPPWELYDQAKDIGEQHNQALEYPAVVERLGARFETWLEPMPPMG